MSISRWLLLALVPLCGCAGRVFTDDDNRKTVQVDVGTTFTVRVQRPPGSQTQPTVQGSILALVGQRSPTSGVHEFEFEARGLGETDLKIPPDYSLRVRVVSASARPGMPVNRP
jgi:hypothetical protein